MKNRKRKKEKKFPPNEASSLIFEMIFKGAILYFGAKHCKTPEDFERLCKLMNTQFSFQKKPIEQMSISELEGVMKEFVKQEKYEQAAQVRDMIAYKKNLNLDTNKTSTT